MFHAEPKNWLLVEYEKHYMDQRMGSMFYRFSLKHFQACNTIGLLGV
jgi:hypothetical protein